jgi:tetratricopeptide (TPR) repeat protein
VSAGARERGVDIDPLWDFEDAAASERRFTDLEAEVLTQRARALGLQKRFAEADALLDQAEALADTVRTRTRIALERGRVRNSSGDKAAARPLFEKAAELADDDALRIDALHMLGIVDAPSWTERALALAEASADAKARRWRASLLNNLAWARHDAGKPAEALAMFERALELRRTEGTPFQIHVARWSVARCLRSLGRNAEALAIQEELAAGMPDDTYVREELAELRKAAAER